MKIDKGFLTFATSASFCSILFFGGTAIRIAEINTRQEQILAINAIGVTFPIGFVLQILGVLVVPICIIMITSLLRDKKCTEETDESV